ncbi:MAG TPA: hypothetical protein VFP39_11000, partial [Gemmatimonadales bacterium]|nr:hypothetical protein [Gemmatimonadales bacterium]
NSVTTYQESTAAAPAPEAATVVYPYYPQGYFPFLFFHRRRMTPPTPPLPPPAIALNLRAAPRAAVPPPPRRIPRIVVTQPTAPSRPYASAPIAEPTPQRVDAPVPMARRFVAAPSVYGGTMVSSAGPSSRWTATPGRSTTTTFAPTAVAPLTRASSAAAAVPARVVVPSRAAVERARGH